MQISSARESDDNDSNYDLASQAVADAASLAPEQNLASDEIAIPLVPVDKDIAPLVEGSLWKAIWTMSWPLMITTVATSVVGMVDVQVAGIIGSSAQAAVGLAEQVIFLFMIFFMSLGVGTTAIVSRAFGEMKRDDADFATAQSISLAVLAGLVLTLVSLFSAHYLLPFFSKAPDVMAQGDLYLSIFSLYLVPFSLVCVVNSAFRAIGDAKTPLVIVVTEVVINIVGDYLTVVGNWPVHGLGIRGIAISATVGAVVGAAVALWRLQQSPLKKSLKRLLPLSGPALNRVLHIGLPAAFQRLSWAGSVFVVFFLLARVPDPTPALASWAIGMRVEAILFMPLMALSLSVSSIVGQNLGAGQDERAVKAGWHVANIGVVLMVVLGLLVFVFAPQLSGVMSHDPKTIEYASGYLRINALAAPMLAINMILSGALQGAGDTRYPMWVSIFANWVLRLPLAWILTIALHWGPNGVWSAMSVSNTLSALVIALRYHAGGWVKQKV